jgi:pimeloyl-ACP methyl ester carboxylesterase
MGEDAAALLRYLRIAKTDVIGYSDGGNVALALAMRHPGLVRKVVVMGTNYSNEGLVPEVRKQIEAGAKMPQAEVVKDIPPQFQKAYADVAPRPGDWPELVSKVMNQGATFRGRTPAQIRSIAAPTLIVLADRDIVAPEHAAAMFRLHRDGQLAIIPGRDHITLVEQSATLTPILLDFLKASSRPKPPADTGQ